MRLATCVKITQRISLVKTNILVPCTSYIVLLARKKKLLLKEIVGMCLLHQDQK